jgi:hypothetical protein
MRYLIQNQEWWFAKETKISPIVDIDVDCSVFGKKHPFKKSLGR